jgi:hypothetical protein
MSAMEAFWVASEGFVTTVVMMAMMMRVVAQKTEVQMRMGRRPNMSGRKYPVRIAT